MFSFFKQKLTVKEKIIVMACMLLLGAVLSMQARAVYENRQQEEAGKQKELNEYLEKINELKEEVQSLTSDITTLKGRYAIYLKNLEQNEPVFYNRLKHLNDSIQEFKLYACLTDVKGPGIEIRMDDGEYDMIVHDNFLYELVNELRAAGAQAIEVNGKRVVTSTEFLCIGPSIRVNDEGVFAPYVIKAIGEPSVLERRVNESFIYGDIESRNIRIDIRRYDEIYIRKYNDDYYKKIRHLAETE